MLTEDQVRRILQEVFTRTSRSGGKGGQNVNKVETRVELKFDVAGSEVLSEQEKSMIIARVGEEIRVACEKHRTQLQNKSEAKQKLVDVINKALRRQKKRVATRPSRSGVRKRLEQKSHASEKKAARRRPDAGEG